MYDSQTVEPTQENSDFEKKLKAATRFFKKEIKGELRRRERHLKKKGNRRRDPLPEMHMSDLAKSLLHRARIMRFREETTLTVYPELPDDLAINGAVAVLEAEETGEIVMTLDKVKRDRWSFPGGGREADEMLARTVQRENKEEIGLDVSEFPFVFIGLVPLHHEPNLRRVVVYARVPLRKLQDLRPGREQEKVELKTPTLIELMVRVGKMPPNHINYWGLFKQWKSTSQTNPL